MEVRCDFSRIELKDENDEFRTRVYKVDEKTYDAFNVGDWIDFGK